MSFRNLLPNFGDQTPGGSLLLRQQSHPFIHFEVPATLVAAACAHLDTSMLMQRAGIQELPASDRLLALFLLECAGERPPAKPTEGTS